MENYNDEIFGFGDYTSDNSEQIENFNYDSISGLGQSDYENEDLFNAEAESDNTSIFDNYYNQEPINVTNGINNVGVNYVENNELYNSFSNQIYNQNPFIQNFGVSNNVQESLVTEESLDNFAQNDSFEDFINETPVNNNNVNTVEKMNFDPMTGESLNSMSLIEQPIVDSALPNIEEKAETTNIFAVPNFEEPQIEVLPDVETPVVEETTEEVVPPIGPGLPGYAVPEITPVTSKISSVPEYFEEKGEPSGGQLVTENLVFKEMPIIQESAQQEIISPSEYNTSVDPIPVEPITEYFEEKESPAVEPLVMEQPQVDGLLETPVVQEQFAVSVQSETPQEKIEISDTPIEQLNKLTEYEEDRIEETDINALFDKVSVNFKDASDIFRKNSDLKHKIDVRFEELKKLQSELENSRKNQLDEINNYKTEVLEKLTEKKEEIERRLNVLKESQATFEREKKEFEEYKKKEQDNIDRVQKEVQSAYDDRREELNHIEDVLRKQKDSLDEERSQLSLDRIQYESDKNELANNLLKFNELVNSFTNGVNDIRE